MENANITAKATSKTCVMCQELLPNNPEYWNELLEPMVRNSLSRRDNKTYICNDCGNAEALADYQEGLELKEARLITRKMPAGSQRTLSRKGGNS